MKTSLNAPLVPKASNPLFVALAVNFVWINLSEVARYFLFIMPMMRDAFSMVPNVAPMNVPTFLIWGVWDVILVAAATLIPWLMLGQFGGTGRNAILAGTAVWMSIFVILWLGLFNMNLATPAIVLTALPLAWIECCCACRAVVLLSRTAGQPMSKTLSQFEAIPDLDGLYVAHKNDLRCTALRLATGALCLYSPVSGLGEEARHSLEALGEVTHLLAPNHYHHKGLAEYAAAFPGAKLCCTDKAKPRLDRQTGLSLTPLDEADLPLPDATRLVEPDGLKTGEVWVAISAPEHRIWVVTDAFCGPKASTGAFARAPEMLRTFPSYGIADPKGYSKWLSRYASSFSPTMIVPCHGALISSPHLPGDTWALVKTTLGGKLG